jgi:hypothetical protein
MAKPVVHYYLIRKHNYINVGQSASVYPVDHPSALVSNMRICHTSKVLWYDETTGEFETENTKYVPFNEHECT